jgi:two-component system, chemotaxis family, response regulator Rcp1
MPDPARPIEILLVEDNPVDAMMIREALHLAKIRHQLTILEDGEAALRYLRNEPPHDQAARPEVVILDLRLPRVSGHAVLGAMKADPDLRPIPVMVLTTSSAQRDIAKSYDLHADQFVSKPVGLNVLAGELRIIEGLAARARQQ